MTLVDFVLGMPNYETPTLSMGQLVYMYTFVHRRDLALKIKGTDCDISAAKTSVKDPRWGKFIDFLQENWNK